MTQPEALRLADHLEREYYVPAAYELRRLCAENETLRDSNEAKADRIDRLGETIEKLKTQRDELLEALKLADAMLRGANMDSAFVQKKVEAAIAKVEGNK